MNIKPLKQSEFTSLDNPKRREYLEALEAEYHPTKSQVCKMLGGQTPISEKTLSLFIVQSGANGKLFNRGATSTEQERKWAMFLYGLVLPTELKEFEFDGEKINADIFNRISKYVDDNKINLKKLMIDYGCATSATYSDWRNHKTHVRASFIVFLKDRYGLDMNYLLTGEETLTDNKTVPAPALVPTVTVKEKVVYKDRTQEILDKAFNEIGQQMEYLESIPKNMLTPEAYERVGKDDVYKLAIDDIRLKVAEIIAEMNK